MIKSYLLIGMRNLLKNKMITLFNILGLSLAFGSVIVIFLFIEYNYTVDDFHKEGSRIFLITHERSDDGRYYGTSPVPLGPALKEEVSGIEHIVRLETDRAIVNSDNHEPFYEYITYSDPDFFKLFNFPLAWGKASSLQDPSKVIISDDAARKYFGKDNPVGETLNIHLSNGKDIAVTVGGVSEPFPKKRSFDFNVLVNIQHWLSDSTNEDWSMFVDATFIKVGDSKAIGQIGSSQNKFLSATNRIDSEYRVAQFGFEPLPTLAQESYRIRNVIVRGFGPPSGKIAFSTIGILLIVLACLNYVNTATALGVKRLKEIGIRKVVGGRRKATVFQFLVENLIISVLSLFIGIVIAKFIFLPGFDNLFLIGLTFDLTNIYLWFFFLAILVFTSMLSGVYPALYVSKYKAVEILRGDRKIGTKSVFSKVLLSFQFMFSFIYIVSSLLFIANESYQRNRGWGYESEDLLVVIPASESAYQYLRNKLLNNSNVEMISGANEHVGHLPKEATIQVDTSYIKVHQFTVDTTYLETLSMQMASGSSFAGDLGADRYNIIVNETFVSAMGWEQPLSESVKINNEIFYVRGVVKDFRYSDFQRKIEPILFRLSADQSHRFLVAHAKPGQSKELHASLKTWWHSVSPDAPFDGFYQDEIIERFFLPMSGHSKVMTFSAILAVAMACMGLFGLVYLHIVARMKDYSIMKVLGINSFDLSKQVLKIFIWLLAIAIAFGFPISLLLSKMLFRIVYADHISVTMFYPMLGAMVLIAISIFTVSFLIMRLLKGNPVETLRSE